MTELEEALEQIEDLQNELADCRALIKALQFELEGTKYTEFDDYD